MGHIPAEIGKHRLEFEHDERFIFDDEDHTSLCPSPSHLSASLHGSLSLSTGETFHKSQRSEKKRFFARGPWEQPHPAGRCNENEWRPPCMVSTSLRGSWPLRALWVPGACVRTKRSE